MHQPYGGVSGQISDINIQADEILRNRDVLNQILADACGKSKEDVAKDTDRDFFLTALEAVDYGVVDDLLRKPLTMQTQPTTTKRPNRTQTQYLQRRSQPCPIPYVVESNGRDERVYDIYSRLLKDRIVFGICVNEVANAIVAQMLFLQSDDPKADIHFYINSPAEGVQDLLDTPCSSSLVIATYCIYQAASMGALLPPDDE